MNKLINKISFIATMAVYVMLASLLLELLFEGADSIIDQTLEDWLFHYLFFIVFVSLSSYAIEVEERERIALYYKPKEKKQFSRITRLVIYTLGLPLAGLMLSVITVEILNSIGFNFDFSSFAMWSILIVTVQTPILHSEISAGICGNLGTSLP